MMASTQECFLYARDRLINVTFLAYFIYSEKIEVSLCYHHAVCACISPVSTFE